MKAQANTFRQVTNIFCSIIIFSSQISLIERIYIIPWYNKLIRLLIATSLCWIGLAARAEEPLEQSIIDGTAWSAIDGLGRILPTASDVGPPATDRFVGMFYFLWHNQQGSGHNDRDKSPHDVSKILAADPQALFKPDSLLWGAVGIPHYWGEPLFGYYRSTDPWVLRRHASMLVDAGIDTLVFDTTNAVTYPEVYLKLCEVFLAIHKEGGRTPPVAFMVNTAAAETANKIFDEFYAKELYPVLWFRWQGKPLMLCDPKVANDKLRKFFTLRRAHWPFTMENTRLAWHWEATYPQPFGFDRDGTRPEQMSVSVAQNLQASDGQVTDMSRGDARGRGFHNGNADHRHESINAGLNFEEQWRRALNVKPQFVLVTGWNEWFATRFQRPEQPIVFIDQFDQEYSRDIEPMKGGHGDNYYYQLVANVRQFKGVPSQPRSPANRTIDIDGDASQWQAIKTTFHDHVGETIARDFDGINGLHYTNHSGRNDIVETKVCRDTKHVYFWVRTREMLTAPTDSNWMWLLIDHDQNNSTGWRGFDLIVNRSTGTIEVNQGGWKWKEIAKVNYRVQNDQLQLALPVEALGHRGGSVLAPFDFKWIDNMQNIDDELDVHISGDAAPDGRFCYRCMFE